MACGGYSGWDGQSLLPNHTDAVSVHPSTSAMGRLRCERHQDSDDVRSVWACEPW